MSRTGKFNIPIGTSVKNRQPGAMSQEIFQGYGPKTLVTGWYHVESVAKDYDAYHPPGGSQFGSTYKRLGTYVPESLSSETASSQRKALVKRKPPAKKPLINMVSYSSTLGEERKKHWKAVNITLPPDTVDCTNYVTVSKTDYINFFPEARKVTSRALIMKPETKFRRLMVDGSDPRRHGINTFYDDNMDFLNVKQKSLDPPPYGLCYEPKPYGINSSC